MGKLHMLKKCGVLNWGIVAVVVVMALACMQSEVLAANSLGLGNPEPAIQPSGPFAGVLFWIQQQQKEFYQLTSETLKHIRSGKGGTWLLISLSFAYGVLHAAGPGHGKAVLSSYVLANEVALRRGILLSFASAALQAVTAIAAIGLLTLVLAGLGLRQSEFTRALELTSYLAIIVLGVWLLWKKLRPAGSRVASKGHDHVDDHAHHHHESHGHDHQGAELCAECGHSHMPDPRQLGGKFNIREAWTAVLAVGLRPCSGALIVLSFAFLNGLYLAGIASTFAMAFGTGLTVAMIASIAVMAKGFALRVSGKGQANASVLRWIEIAGALFVLLVGLTLLMAALS
jgi:ABC-type nickel/cobalt efflux system permease component RcnA